MIEKELTFDYQELIQQKNQRELGIWMKNFIDKNGFLILQNLKFEGDVEQSKLFFSKLCSSIGTLVPHNPGKKDFVWEIKPNLSTSIIKTFSEHNQDAPLHTDSQYRNHPERFMALMTLNQARCGGGYTELVDFKKILQDLESTVIGKKIIDFFRNESFPIAIPTVFQEMGKPEYIMSKLISNNPLIRYRYDTLKAGLLLSIDKENKLIYCDRIDKLDLLNNFIQLSPHRLRFLLASNEAIILDNHRFLHGRSSFTDSQRLLLRCRMN